MTKFRRTTFFLFLMITFGFAVFWYASSDSFRLTKITGPLPKNHEWEFSLDRFIIEKTFSKPLTYLERGGQSFVFETANKEYVVKFFRYDRLQPTFWMRLLQPERIKKKREKLHKTMDSYRIAYQYLQEETGVFCVHLTQTDFLNKKATLIDKTGRSYLVDLDSVGFLIQKKVPLLGSIVNEIREKGDFSKLRLLISEYLELVKRRSNKGFVVTDHNRWTRNYGYDGEKIYEIDVGSYRKQPVNNRFVFLKNNLDHTRRFYDYISKEVPEVLSHTEKEMRRIF